MVVTCESVKTVAKRLFEMRLKEDEHFIGQGQSLSVINQIIARSLTVPIRSLQSVADHPQPGHESMTSHFSHFLC